jgi:hypothetical protein
MFSIPDYLTLRLGEEAAEVAQSVGKSLAYGHKEVNVKEPTGPNNTDKLVGELNDLIAVVEMLVEVGVLPWDWRDEKTQAEKKAKVVTFMAHSYNQDRIELGEEEALEELCQRYLGTDISSVCDGIASGVEEWKRERTPVDVKPAAPEAPPSNIAPMMRSPATVTQVFDPPLKPAAELQLIKRADPATLKRKKPAPRSPIRPYTAPRMLPAIKVKVSSPVILKALPTLKTTVGSAQRRRASPTPAQQMTIYLGRIVGVTWPQHWSYQQFKDRVEAELPGNADAREHLRDCARRLMEQESKA